MNAKHQMLRSVWVLASLVGVLGCGSNHFFDRGERVGPAAPDEDVQVSFVGDVKPLLAACTGCHGQGAGGWTYDGGAGAHAAIVEQIDRNDPAASHLLQKVSGQASHAGGVFFAPGSSGYETILNWISAGGADN